jgi:Tfp pilus assembly protein PilN
MFFRRRQKADTSKILDDLARTIELVDALVEQEQATGLEMDGGPRAVTSVPQIEPRLQAVTAN